MLPVRAPLPLPLLIALGLCAVVAPAGAASLAETPIEELMNIPVEVSSAARKAQRLEDTAAAIHVITREDIRRSGLTSVPELLRLVPGLQVARIDVSTWAISSRGFNAKNSDNLLVMRDGRTLHTPTFTGVYWDAQDVFLEDIERIEVIRGPGGALWGSNAVSGIINIITRGAAETQGGVVKAVAGDTERQGTVRVGGRLGESGHYRVFARGLLQDAAQTPAGLPAHDRRDLRSAGFRADWALSGGHSLTVQGDAYDGVSRHGGSLVTLAPPATRPTAYGIDLNGHNLLARWKQAVSPGSEWTAQVYFDRYARRYFNLGEERDTVDLDIQHRLQPSPRHDIVWGLTYRHTRDRMRNTAIVGFLPEQRTDRIYSVFFQDEFALLPERLHLIFGSKLEHNDYSGFEPQPNLRLRWRIDERNTAWAAVSRAVHTPSRNDHDGRVVSTVSPGGALPTALITEGSPAVGAERVLAIEAGYRIHPSERISADLALFRNEHRSLMTLEPAAAYTVNGVHPYRVSPLVFANLARARTQGIELSANWRPADRWQVQGALSLLDMTIRRAPDSLDRSIEGESGRSPRRQARLMLTHAPRAGLDCSAILYRVDPLPTLGVPAYTRLDLRIGWRPAADLEWSLAVQNLTDRGHVEFINPSGPRHSEVPRSIYLAATWRF